MWEHARVASQNYLRNCSAGVYLTVSPEETYSGSAICIDVNGRLFIATAAHNFEGVEGGATFVVFSANRSSETPLEIVASNLAQNLPPGTPDLAWLEIAAESARASDLTGVSLESLAAYPILNAMDGYVATGFPVGMRREERQRANHINHVVPLLVYFTAAARIDDGTIVLNYQREGLGPHGPGQLAEPQGMSGGAIWHVPTRIEENEIWNPARIRLIGITTRYSRNREELEGRAMNEWLQLLERDLPDLAPSINPILQNQNR